MTQLQAAACRQGLLGRSARQHPVRAQLHIARAVQAALTCENNVACRAELELGYRLRADAAGPDLQITGRGLQIQSGLACCRCGSACHLAGAIAQLQGLRTGGRLATIGHCQRGGIQGQRAQVLATELGAVLEEDVAVAAQLQLGGLAQSTKLAGRQPQVVASRRGARRTSPAHDNPPGAQDQAARVQRGLLVDQGSGRGLQAQAALRAGLEFAACGQAHLALGLGLRGKSAALQRRGRGRQAQGSAVAIDIQGVRGLGRTGRASSGARSRGAQMRARAQVHRLLGHQHQISRLQADAAINLHRLRAHSRLALAIGVHGPRAA